MKLNRINRVLAVVLVVVVAALLLVRVDRSRPNYVIALGDDMTHSPAYDAYSSNENFADGRTWQAPVPGTVARGEMPLHFEATPEGALAAGEQLTAPFDPSSDEGLAAVARGRKIFLVSCVVCHGSGGAGDGPVARRGFPPPPSLLAGKSLEMRDGQLFHILTYGQGSMKPFAAQLDIGQRWDVISYVRDLQRQAAATADDASPPADPPSATQPPETEDPS